MRKLKTQNKGRNTIEVKVTLKPEIAKLLDAAIQLKNPDLKFKLNNPCFRYTDFFRKNVGWGGLHPFFHKSSSKSVLFQLRTIL